MTETTGIVPFMALVDQVMNSEPYCSARRVFWIVDNGSSNNGQRSIDRMSAAWPDATLVHLPVHASWLNQIEVCSRSSSARSSDQPTSLISASWPTGWSGSSTATTPPPPFRLAVHHH